MPGIDIKSKKITFLTQYFTTIASIKDNLDSNGPQRHSKRM